MAKKVSYEDLNRNKRAQKNARFADKKIQLTRRAILDRLVNMYLVLKSCREEKKNLLNIKLLYIYVENVITFI